MSDPKLFVDGLDLASDRLGGAVIYASDDFFAEKENLLKPSKATWLEDEYTDRGKWMDGWESRRRFGRKPGHDFCLIRLGAPGIVRGVIVDTAFFRGNYPEKCSIEGCDLAGYPSPEELLDPSVTWTPILAPSALRGDSENPFAVDAPFRVTHLRFNIFPDGGVARLRVFGDAMPHWPRHGGLGGEIDLAAAECGGLVVACTDMFFGSRHNLIFPGLGAGMHDGWETKRRRGDGHDHAVLRLAARGAINRVVVDTGHFKGNAPDRFSLEGGIGPDGPWTLLMDETKLQPHTRHVFVDGLRSKEAFDHVRFHIYPDGGVSRLSLFGNIASEARNQVRLRHLNALTPAAAERELRACCASGAWARAVAAARPFAKWEELEAAAERAFSALGDEDWLEAFRGHPKIGASSHAAPNASWAGAEQSGMASANDRVRAMLAEKNRAYEARFGFIFIVCATGKSAEEMLAILESRIGNDASTELRIAAAEQVKITRLRLGKWLG